MVKFQELKENQLSQVLGGTHHKRGGGKYQSYGNGVYCNRYYCHDNLAQMWDSVGRIMYTGWQKDGPFAHPLV